MNDDVTPAGKIELSKIEAAQKRLRESLKKMAERVNDPRAKKIENLK